MSHSEASPTPASLSDPTEAPRVAPSATESRAGSAVSVGARMDSPTVITSRRHVAPHAAQAIQPPEIIARLRGERLGHFELDDLIGSGGMAAVFLARDTRLDRHVALKVLPQTPDTDPDLVQRFDNEARAAARLEHENIARVYSVGAERGVHFIAFEYVEGTNLRDLIEQSGRLPLAEAVNYCLQITGALVHSASRDVVHRDVKPSNIIVTPAGRAKLVDMGLARRFETDHDGGVTQSGVTLGTFDYISPEQARDPRTADIRSDIYSLGCTLYHMLTGLPPFPEGTIAQKLLAHQAEEPPSPQDHNPQVPDDLAAIVAKMMAKQPRRRYRDPEQLYRDLLLMAGALGLRSTSPEGLIWMSPTRPHVPAWERHAPLVIPVVTLLAVSAFLFIWQRKAINESDLLAESSASVATAAAPQAATSAEQDPSRAARAPNEGPVAAVGEGAVNGSTRADRSEAAGHEPADPFAELDAPPLSVAAQPERGSTSAPERSPGAAAVSQADEQTRANEPPRPATPDDVSNDQAARVDSARPEGGVVVTSKKEAVETTDRSFEDTRPEPRTFAPTNRAREDRQSAANTPATIDREITPGTRPFALAPTEQPEPESPRRFDQASAPLAANTSPANDPMPEVVRPNTLVVDPAGSGDRVYRTIEAALNGAASDSASVIELRYNGRQQEEPFKINGIRVTIRPAAGFRPVVTLVPKQIPTQGYRTRMISVSGGSLSLVDLHLELRLPAGGDRWSLFYLQNPEKLSLEGCTVTLRNPSVLDAALVELDSQSATTATLGTLAPDSSLNPVELKFRNCFLRGEADVILCRQPQAIRIDFTNDVVAASGRLLRVMGGTQSRANESIELGIDHTSARTDSGLVLLEATETGQYLVPVRMTTSNNIFQTRSLVPEDSPLVMMTGPRDTESLAELVQETSSIGMNNFYEGYEIFREIRSSSGNNFMMNTAGRSTWNFEAWQIFRGSQESEPRLNQVRWETVPILSSPAEAEPSDWVLADGPNPARGGTSDGSDAGANLDNLPRLPSRAAD